MTTWQTRLDDLLTEYDISQHSEASAVAVAEHIRDVINSNEADDPELRAYLIASLKELLGYADQAIHILKQDQKGRP